MQITQIKVENPFKDLFRIRDLDIIVADMKANGFDKNEPVILWKNIMLDGHTRREAAIKLGIKNIPVIHMDFETEEEAIWYAIKRNNNRRNVTRGDKFRAFRIVDVVGESGGDGSNQYKKSKGINLEGSKSRTAKIFNISTAQVSKMRVITKYGTYEDIEDIEDDKLSIDAAYKTAKVEKERIEAEIAASKQFNYTNENIDWAKWTWNPVTGCLHGCNYCYAEDIANRFYEQKFKPHFYEGRLTAPFDTKIPKDKINEHGINNVFVSSMGDLFGKWVPKEWIDKVLDAIEKAPQWTFILLTKNPARYADFNIPKNCLLGATATNQAEANKAMHAFKVVGNSNVRFLSCEPLHAKIDIDNSIDWVIIGGQSRTTKVPAMQPEWDWVEHLIVQCNEYGTMYFMKPNLTVRCVDLPDSL